MQYMVQAEVWCRVLLSSLLRQSLPLLIKFPEQPESLINPNVAVYHLIGLNLAFSLTRWPAYSFTLVAVKSLGVYGPLSSNLLKDLGSKYNHQTSS